MNWRRFLKAKKQPVDFLLSLEGEKMTEARREKHREVLERVARRAMIDRGLFPDFSGKPRKSFG